MVLLNVICDTMNILVDTGHFYEVSTDDNYVDRYFIMKFASCSYTTQYENHLWTDLKFWIKGFKYKLTYKIET